MRARPNPPGFCVPGTVIFGNIAPVVVQETL